MVNYYRFSEFEKSIIRFQDLKGDYQIAAKLYLRNYEGQLKKNVRFKLYMIPMDVMKDAIMQIPEMSGFSDVDDYHRYYRERKSYQKRDAVWPVFLDQSFGMVIDSGWGRLHDYVDENRKVIPVLELCE